MEAFWQSQRAIQHTQYSMLNTILVFVLEYYIVSSGLDLDVMYYPTSCTSIYQVENLGFASAAYDITLAREELGKAQDKPATALPSSGLRTKKKFSVPRFVSDYQAVRRYWTAAFHRSRYFLVYNRGIMLRESNKILKLGAGWDRGHFSAPSRTSPHYMQSNVQAAMHTKRILFCDQGHR